MEKSNDLMEYIHRLSRLSRRQPVGEGQPPRGPHRLLGILMKEDGVRTTDLAEKLDVRPSSLSEMLRHMEAKGLIRREKDEADSRVIRVYVTDAARAQFAQHEGHRQERGDRLRACLTDEEAEAFCAACEKLCAFLESEMPEQDGERRGPGGCPHGRGPHGRGGHPGYGPRGSHGPHGPHGMRRPPQQEEPGAEEQENQ